MSIPKIIWQTWQHSRLPPEMRKRVETLKAKHPDFQHIVYDDILCRQFMKENYPEFLGAYDTLIPGAYKSDLWRMCVLYKYGGIYFDIKFEIIGDFTFHSVLDKNYFAKDYSPDPTPHKHRIAIAFIVTVPNNPLIMKCIRHIVSNVDNHYYGETPFDITGPDAVGKALEDEEFEFEFNMKPFNMRQAVYRGRTLVLLEYKWYRTEQRSELTHYTIRWNDKNVFGTRPAPRTDTTPAPPRPTMKAPKEPFRLKGL